MNKIEAFQIIWSFNKQNLAISNKQSSANILAICNIVRILSIFKGIINLLSVVLVGKNKEKLLD